MRADKGDITRPLGYELTIDETIATDGVRHILLSADGGAVALVFEYHEKPKHGLQLVLPQDGLEELIFALQHLVQAAQDPTSPFREQTN